jgi:hypothetical protein
VTEALADQPFYRRSNTVASMLFASMVLGFGGPMVVEGLFGPFGKIMHTLVGLLLGAPLCALCALVMLGHVVDETTHGETKWGFAHRVVAALVFVAWGYSIVARFL